MLLVRQYSMTKAD